MRHESWKRENRHSSSIRHTQELQSNDRRILTMKSATQRSRSAISKNDVKAETVRVAVRCRPELKKEIADDHQRVVQVNCKLGTIQLEKPTKEPSNGSMNGSMTNSTLSTSKLTNSSYSSNTNNNTNNEDDNMKIYTFDSVYDENSTQEEIYADIFHPLVDSVLEGFNGTIFAYGQTGTGKTFTMEGTADNPGVIPRSFTHIFSHIARSTDKQFLVRVSYLEIYQENIRDLLSSDIDQKLVLREKPDNGVYVEDLSSFVCKNVEEIEKRLTKGRQNRAVGSTNMNEHSSRSHAIFMITIEHSSVDSSGNEHIKVGKLNLVDLAGSERLTKTKSSGIRQKEGITINLSLSALSNVISALVDGRSKHIPYRDSKLTRLLQDSLGGNARTVMVANIGPSSYNYEETLTTLRYANRAKNIKNKPRVNQDPKDALLREFQDEIERLRQQLELRRKAKSRQDPNGNLDSLANKNNEAIDFEAVQKIQSRINAMESKMLVGGKNIVDHTNEQQRELESRMELLRQQRQREREMLRKLNEQEEATQEVRETFTSLQQEVELKRRKLRKVVKEFQSVNSEIRDLNDNNSEERLELDGIFSDLMRELKFRYLIIDNFIPEQEKTKFLRKIYYDENDEEWHYRPTSGSGSDSQTGADSEMESSTYSRPGTAISRPSSVYMPNSDRQNSHHSHNQSSIYSNLYDMNNGGKHSRFLLGFKVPFYTERVDQLGLYLPERTTMDYDSYMAQNEQDEDDDLEIDIIDVNDDKRAAKSSKWIGNERMIGKTPPPMRRSLTMMNNYSNDQTMDIVDLWETMDAADSTSSPSSQSTSNLVALQQSSPNASTMLDLKRANVRRKLCQSASQRNIENLNVRPDTAFPRSRGLVPK